MRAAESINLGVETNIANWQRRQNSSNNFSAVGPYEWSCSEKRQRVSERPYDPRPRMMFAVITMVIVADSKEELDSDTDAVIAVGRKQCASLPHSSYQQLDGLNTVCPLAQEKSTAAAYIDPQSLAVFMPLGAGDSGCRRHLFRRERDLP